MNLLLRPESIKPQFIYFSDAKPNVLFDGIFTKINYCNDFFTMYGMHISLNNIKYDTIHNIETVILDAYMEYTGKPVIKNYKLSNDKILLHSVSRPSVKISGVWENKNGEIGISYKL